MVGITEEIELDPKLSVRLSQDLLVAARELRPNEVRYIVDSYYQIQDYRKAANNQVRSMQETGEPAGLLKWLASQQHGIERQIVRAMDAWSDGNAVAAWAKSNVGIGPVLSAGLAAHIDFSRARTVGQVWRFAGLDPTVKWEKGQKPPYNQRLKVMCWRLSDSFVKFSNHPGCFYGHLYRQRKEQEVIRNEQGLFADQAAAMLATKNIKVKAIRAIYESGKLPPGHLDNRARRWTAKLFLSHMHQVWWEIHGDGAPVPFSIAHQGHVDVIQPPNWPMT